MYSNPGNNGFISNLRTLVYMEMFKIPSSGAGRSLRMDWVGGTISEVPSFMEQWVQILDSTVES